MPGLTAKQQRFVEEYLIDLNATQAAIRAGYSVKNADKIGPALIGKSRIKQAIDKAMAERSRRTGITQDNENYFLYIFPLVRAAWRLDLPGCFYVAFAGKTPVERAGSFIGCIIHALTIWMCIYVIGL